MAAIQYLHVVPGQSPDNNQQLVSQSMDLARYMCAEWSVSFRPGFARGLLKFLARGFDPALIRAVIDETATAPCPSWAYFNAIMRRAEASGAYSLAAFTLFSSQAGSGKRACSGKTVSAQQYTQREYTEADLLAVSDDLIAEARRLRNN